MTSEIKTLIEPKDVVGIEIGCPECGVKVTFPLNGRSRMPVKCGNCNADWFDMTTDTYGKNIYPAHNNLSAISRAIQELNTQRTDIHAEIRLHINIEPKAAK